MTYFPDLTVRSFVFVLCGGLATSANADVAIRDERVRAVSLSVAGNDRLSDTDLLNTRDCTTACSLELGTSHDCVHIVPQSAFIPKGLRAETMPPEMARRWAEAMTVHYPPTRQGWFQDYGQHIPTLVSRPNTTMADAPRCR